MFQGKITAEERTRNCVDVQHKNTFLCAAGQYEHFSQNTLKPTLDI